VITNILGISDPSGPTDGTVENTLKLGGLTQTGYLKASVDCTSSDKWTNIDTGGRPGCGTTTPIIGDFGKISYQDCTNSTVYHSDGTLSGSTATGDILKAGDILRTPVGCTLTIIFPDLSLLRLDGDTVVSLDLGYLANGTTIASALLENGSLW
jgi:hypothetical protein